MTPGMKFTLKPVPTDNPAYCSQMGWKHIEIMDRVLSRVDVRDVMRDDRMIKVHSHFYELICIADNDCVTIDYHEFESELIEGYYSLDRDR
tara:strand:+ start:3571 stop:3843 length:273 start_codon:yes stop_codon:yes gene_type:complete